MTINPTIINRDYLDQELQQVKIPLKIGDDICHLALEKVRDTYVDGLSTVVIHLDNDPAYSSYTVFHLNVSEYDSSDIQLEVTDFYYM
uniref:hypothetical protein n=1 Tax=Candidatus Enterococcus willemsii TaxID=1857215 RepID=UPI00403F63CA